MNLKDSLLIITHRGGKNFYPENTPEAYRHAVEHGAEAVEMDIRFSNLTRRFFLAHDFIHHPKRLWNLLEHAVAEVPKNVTLVIEFKTVSLFTNIFVRNFKKFYDERLTDYNNVLVISFNPFVLMRLRRVAPDIPRGFICGSMIWMFLYHWFLWRFVDAHYYVLNKRFLNTKIIRWSRERGMKIFTYVINTVKYWKKALHYEVDGVITDYPVKMSKLRSEL